MEAVGSKRVWWQHGPEIFQEGSGKRKVTGSKKEWRPWASGDNVAVAASFRLMYNIHSDWFMKYRVN